MKVQAKALLWACIIIAAAILMNGGGVSDSASLAVIIGLTGSAWANIGVKGGCARSCRL